ncbi:MAG: imidazole glycerol phosphate synthase subunit HisH [Deltaproteobacteria bacterium]|jgi:glutamine amidotransferase|nr:imidazole glycerol phosphate synthase subunit HisH [Deltaproteobacteria bacterium]
MITIIDYEMGNLRSVAKAFETLGFDVCVSNDPNAVATSDKVVLPGVGAFRDCIHNLRAGGFVEPILKHVAAGKPLLGICVGMQMMFDESEEFGVHQGLGLIPGRVKRFPAGMVEGGERLKVPHMGWNSIQIVRPAPIFNDVADQSFVYFVHSYYCAADQAEHVAALCRYGDITFSAAIWRDNLMATQFHPEKSQSVGLAVFRNFAAL